MKRFILAALLATGLALPLSGCANTWEGMKSDVNDTFPGSSVNCPYCNTAVSRNAVVCYKCKRDLAPYASSDANVKKQNP